MIRRLLGSGVEFVEVAVGVPVAVPKEAVLRTVFVRVSDLVSSCRIYSVSAGTMQVCDLLTASLSVVPRAVQGQRWFVSCFAFDRRSSSDCRGYP